MDEKPTIEQEAQRLDLRADERDLDRAFSFTKGGVLAAAAVVALLLLAAAFLLH